MLRFLIFCILFSSSFLVLAQDELPMFTVTGNRLSSSIMASGRNMEVITKTDIEMLPVNHLNEVLQYVAGVDFRQRGAFGAQADVSIRGGTFEQTLILLNGIKVSDPQTGHHNMNLGIDLNAIERIEVIKGPAAARYGLNTFSGVINIITLPKDTAGVSVSSTVAQSSNQSATDPFYGGYEVQSTAHFGASKSRHMVSGTRQQSTGYRPNTDLDRNSLFYQGVSETKWGTFDAMASILANAFGASGFYAYPIDANSEEVVNTYLFALTHKLDFARWRLSSRIYSRKNFDTYTLFRDAPEIFQNRHRTDVEGAELHGALEYSFGTVGVGLEYRREAINSSNLGQWLRDNGGVFLENRMLFAKKKLAVNTGAYLNVSSDYGTQLLPSIEASYNIKKHWSIFGNAGQSFRVPTFTDLYYVGPTNLGNADLQPEQSNQFEGGFKWHHAMQFLQVSYFYQQATDLIDWVRMNTLDPWQPQNHERVNTSGIDAAYSRRFDIEKSRWLRPRMAKLGYTWLQMEQTSSDALISRYALNNLNHQVTASCDMLLGRNYAVSLTGRYLDRNAYKDYMLLDARLQYKKERFELWLDASNLLNTYYIEVGNAPMPRRWFRLGLQFNLI
jgi:iron complex outermembrane receptor protein